MKKKNAEDLSGLHMGDAERCWEMLRHAQEGAETCWEMLRYAETCWEMLRYFDEI